MKTTLGVLAASVVVAVGVALLALVGAAGTALACLTAPMPALADAAPVAPATRVWIAAVQQACPRLPQPWIAAVMNADSAFDAGARSARGFGPITITDNAWAAIRGTSPTVDLDHDGAPDSSDPIVASDAAGRVLCQQLDDIATGDTAGSAPLSPLDALTVVHRGGAEALSAYPAIATELLTYLEQVHRHAVAWTAAPTTSDPPVPPAAVDDACATCMGAAGSVVIPPGTSAPVATACANALDLVGARSGWYRRCDRLACRAYGYANSGYESASVHWARMLGTGHAHPGDRCPPLGAFVYWATGSPDGHIALVVASDPACDPARIKVVTNDALDHVTGFTGGVYLVTLAQIEQGFMNRANYRGWSDPICAGARQPGTQ